MMPKSLARLTVISMVLAAAEGFSSSAGALPQTRTSSTASYAYVPAGFTPESWKKFQQNEKAKQQRNLGKLGPRGFESRSMQSFQEALERGEAAHLMPMFNAKEKLAKGKIRQEDIPYMQRGGAWDNSDVKGAKNRKKWLPSDKKYASGGYRKEQSVSIFGIGQGLDWTGSQPRAGPEGAFGAPSKFAKNYKPLNVNDLKETKSGSSGNDAKKAGGFFGLF